MIGKMAGRSASIARKGREVSENRIDICGYTRMGRDNYMAWAIQRKSRNCRGNIISGNMCG